MRKLLREFSFAAELQIGGGDFAGFGQNRQRQFREAAAALPGFHQPDSRWNVFDLETAIVGNPAGEWRGRDKDYAIHVTVNRAIEEHGARFVEGDGAGFARGIETQIKALGG